MMSGLSSLRRWAEVSPDKPAIILNGEATSYAELLRLVNRARGMLDQRVSLRSGIVSISMTSLLHAWVWALAAGSLGYQTVTIPRRAITPQGPDRMAAAITDEADLTGVDTAPNELVLTRLMAVDYLFSDAPIPVSDRIEAGSHIMISSGTTGSGKGVEFNEEALAALYVRVPEAFGFARDSVIYLWEFLLVTAVGYRYPMVAWHVGATVVFSQNRPQAPAIRSTGPTHAVFTPGLLGALLAEGGLEKDDRLRVIVTGGAMDWSLAEQCRRDLTENVWSLYGSTEAGTICLTHVTRPEDTRTYSMTPSSQVQLLDENGADVAQGEVGTVWVNASPGVTGYWNDEATTLEWFRDGLFCTGDLGRVEADERLTILGRAGDVIIIRGDKRPSLPYETRIQQLTGLTACLFVVQGLGAGLARVVVEAAAPLTLSQVEGVRQALSELAMPVEIVPVAVLPRNHMGKIVRREIFQATGNA